MGHRDIKTTQRYADYAPSEDEAKWVEAAFSARGHIGGHKPTKSRRISAT
jgi:hypothetical protein